MSLEIFFEICLINKVTILLMSAELSTPGLPKIKIFQNKGYDVIILDNNVTNKVSLRDSTHIVDAVM